MILDEISDEATKLLEDSCSFVIGAEPSGLAMLPQSENLKLIAGDGMGGCFYEWLSESKDGVSPIVYLSEYGETSRIADSIEDLISIVVNFEEWGSVLTAANKDLDLLKKVINNSRTNIDEEWLEASKRLNEMLGIKTMNYIETIYKAVTSSPKFCPILNTEEGKEPASSFKERPYPC